MTQTYEMLYIIPQDITEEKVPEVTGKVDELLQRHGAQITREDSWGRRKLAYAIKRQQYGTYQLAYFTLETEELPKLEKALRLRQEILRFLIVKYRERTAKEIAEHEERLAKITQHRKRSEAAQASAEAETESAKKMAAEEAQGPVDTAELEKKLDELLDENVSDQ